VGELSLIIQAASGAFPSAFEEITVECNPGTVTPAYLRSLRDSGVNRVSLGIQSLREGELRLLGRIHSAGEARQAMTGAITAGFDNLSVDLIYGIPGQTVAHWSETLREVLSGDVAHLSAYELTMEEGTPLWKDVKEGRVIVPEEGLIEEMYLVLLEETERHGLSRYEISNFAVPGRECRHNLNTWRHGEYLGLGPAAHSFLAGERFYNNPSVTKYIGSLARGLLPEGGRERLAAGDAGFERTMLGLRMAEGLAEGWLAPQHGPLVTSLEAEGLLSRRDGRIFLTTRGVLLSNEIFLRFL